MFNPIGARIRWSVALTAGGLLVLPIVYPDPYFLHLMILSMLFATFASGWNLVVGYAGLKSFGHHAFFGIGAYASALIAMRMDISPWISMWLGAGLASLIGVVVALPVLRIRSIAHIAIVTLAFAEIVRIVISNLRGITRGEMGLAGIPSFDGFTLPLIGSVTFSAADRIPFYYLMLLIFGASLLVIVVLVRSRLGLAIVAIRDAQDAAESLGVNLTYYKTLVFAVSAFLVGLCGAFFAHYLTVLAPRAAVGVDLMVLIIAMVLVGGIGTVTGPVIGAFTLTLGVESLRGAGDFRMLIYGMMIVLIVLILPRGLASIWDELGTRLKMRDRPLPSSLAALGKGKRRHASGPAADAGEDRVGDGPAVPGSVVRPGRDR